MVQDFISRRQTDRIGIVVFGKNAYILSPSTLDYELQTEKLLRRDHFRTITVSAFPDTGVLPSEVLNAAFPRIREVERSLPPGYDVDKHFKPKYNPWDQRMCLVPNGDLFKAIRKGDASVVTETIERFTPGGIKLDSGEALPATAVILTHLESNVVTRVETNDGGSYLALNLAPGDYLLRVGLYDPATLARTPVVLADGSSAEFFVGGTITVR